MRALTLTAVLIPLEYLILVILFLTAQAGYVLITGDTENTVFGISGWYLSIPSFPLVMILYRTILPNYLFVILLLVLFLKNTASHEFGYLVRLLAVNIIAYALFLGFNHILNPYMITEILPPFNYDLISDAIYLTGLTVVISPLVLFYACRRFQKKTVYIVTFVSAGSLMPLVIIAHWVVVWTTS